MTRRFAVKPAALDDAPALARIHVAAWQRAFADFVPASYLQQLAVDAGERWTREIADHSTETFAAWEGDLVVGFMQLHRIHPQKRYGEIRSLYVDPDRWRRGVGRALLDFAVERLLAHQVETAVVWTAAESASAQAFYGANGWGPTGEEVVQELQEGVRLREVKYSKALCP